MKTKIISAFPACGKSYVFLNNTEYKILDSDSNLFSWTTTDDGIKVRDPNFPNNYISHIKKNIDKVDFIFVSSHKQVRDALVEAGIKFILVYPDKTLLNEWIGRCYRRGNTKEFIDNLINNWDIWIDECIEDGKNCDSRVLHDHEYLDSISEFMLYKHRCIYCNREIYKDPIFLYTNTDKEKTICIECFEQLKFCSKSKRKDGE